MDQAKAREGASRLTALRSELLSSYPFFGRLLLHLPFGFADCGTAYTDMSRIVFDPAFVARLGNSELRFLTLHELMHCVLKHCARGRGKDGLLYNIACDIVVNSILLEALGKKDILINGSPAMHLAPDGSEGRLHSAEAVYEMLLFDDTPRKKPKESPFPVAGAMKREDDETATQKGKQGTTNDRNDHEDSCSNDSESNCKDRKTEKNKRSNDSSASQNDGNRDADEEATPDNAPHPPYAPYEKGRFDNHEPWSSAALDPLAESVMDSKIRAATRACGKSGSGIPRSIDRMVDSLSRAAKISWQQLLHDLLRNTRSDYVFTPPDKRYSGDLLLPSFQENCNGASAENIWFVIDTSGSVSPRAIGEAFAEIRDALEQLDSLTGILSFFDTVVSEPIPFESVEELESIRPIGGGGTDFHIIFRALEAMLEENDEESAPRAVIIITDGYADFPDEEEAHDIPVIWLIVDSEEEPPFGTVLHITSDETET